jgi:hypothetical protein
MGCLVFLMQEGGRALKSAIRKIDEKFSYLLGPQPPSLLSPGLIRFAL